MSEPSLLDNQRIVTVTHVEDSSRDRKEPCVYLWGKYVDSNSCSPAMEKCIANIRKQLECRPAPLYENLQVGQICCVLINHQWHRACVKELELNPHRKLEVQLVDIGASYCAPLASLRTVENISGEEAANIQKHQPIAFKFILADIVASKELDCQWSEMAISFLKSDAQNYDWKANLVAIYGDCQVLRLFHPLGNHLLASTMIHQGFGVPSHSYPQAISAQWIDHTHTPRRAHKSRSLGTPNVNSLPTIEEHLEITQRDTDNNPLKNEIGQRQVYISHIETPGKFWIQLAENEQYVVDLDSEMMKIGTETDSKYLLEDPPVVGQLYAVKHPEIGYWYRAKVLSQVTEKSVAVSLVEYGECLIVPFSDMRKLRRYFQHVPFMAIPCKLATVHLDSWPLKSIDAMKNTCKPENLCAAVFRPQMSDNVMEVESLFVDDINVLELVLEH